LNKALLAREKKKAVGNPLSSLKKLIHTCDDSVGTCSEERRNLGLGCVKCLPRTTKKWLIYYIIIIFINQVTND
jgi:reverse gyrase